MATQTELNQRAAYIAKRDRARADAARAMLAALVDIEQLGATAQTMARVRKAISTATAAGIRLTWQD